MKHGTSHIIKIQNPHQLLHNQLGHDLQRILFPCLFFGLVSAEPNRQPWYLKEERWIIFNHSSYRAHIYKHEKIYKRIEKKLNNQQRNKTQTESWTACSQTTSELKAVRSFCPCILHRKPLQQDQVKLAKISQSTHTTFLSRNYKYSVQTSLQALWH